MSRTGPRPHTWKQPNETLRSQCLAWQRQRAQAKFRGEYWAIDFDLFLDLWRDHWHQRGKSRDDYCMMMLDPDQGWQPGNVEVLNRRLQLQRAQQEKRR